MQITHNEVVTAFGTGCAALVWFLGWWSRGPRAKSLDDAYDRGAEWAIDQAVERVEREGMVLRLSPNGKAVWCDAGSQWDRDGAESSVAFDDVSRPGPVTEQLSAANDEPHRAGRTIYPELAALGAESHPEPSEPVPVRLDETTEEWAARMDMKAAIWCAENGIERVGAS